MPAGRRSLHGHGPRLAESRRDHRRQQRHRGVTFVDTAVEAFGGLDVLVWNAGISAISPLADTDVAGWDAMIDVNLRGVLSVT